MFCWGRGRGKSWPRGSPHLQPSFLLEGGNFPANCPTIPTRTPRCPSLPPLPRSQRQLAGSMLHLGKGKPQGPPAPGPADFLHRGPDPPTCPALTSVCSPLVLASSLTSLLSSSFQPLMLFQVREAP